ncbi:hypothetical protein Lal_00010949 [Lupinus albus]|nr:hypothetical protein Lal_00010949 [Lupinus albus]
MAMGTGSMGTHKKYPQRSLTPSSPLIPSPTSKSELDHYLKESLLPRTECEFDILNWWKTNVAKYPTLQRIAKDLLAIHISTVASESAFSTSGRFLTPHRSRLRPHTLEALMCLQDWLWTDVKGSSKSRDDFNFITNTILDDIDDDDEPIVLCVVDGWILDI